MVAILKSMDGSTEDIVSFSPDAGNLKKAKLIDSRGDSCIAVWHLPTQFRTNCEKIICLASNWHTNLATWTRMIRKIKVLFNFLARWVIVSFNTLHVARSHPIGKRIWVGRNIKVVWFRFCHDVTEELVIDSPVHPREEWTFWKLVPKTILLKCSFSSFFVLLINKYHIVFHYSHFNTFYKNFLKWVALTDSSFSSLFSLGTKISHSLTLLSTVSNSFLFFLDSGRAWPGGSEGGSGGGKGGREGCDGRFEGKEGGIGESDGSDAESIGAFPSRPGAMLPLQRIAR